MCTCVRVWHNNLTSRFDLTADASLLPLAADPADLNVERGRGEAGGYGPKELFYLFELGSRASQLLNSSVYPSLSNVTDRSLKMSQGDQVSASYQQKMISEDYTSRQFVTAL